jgi:hypothetical protein
VPRALGLCPVNAIWAIGQMPESVFDSFARILDVNLGRVVSAGASECTYKLVELNRSCRKFGAFGLSRRRKNK